MSASNSPPVRPDPIRTLRQLQTHLETALHLELATIPAYLTALYSIHDGSNLAAVEAIRSVVVEEMLHVCLAANLLNAVGSPPRLGRGRAGFVPAYPHRLPHSGMKVVVRLLPFSPTALEAFCAIETPEKSHSKPESNQYESIGQFYEAIVQGFRWIFPPGADLPGDPLRQIGPEQYYNSGGTLLRVWNLETAIRACEEIRHQGEGVNDSTTVNRKGGELTHFARFREVLFARKYLHGQKVTAKPTGEKIPVHFEQVYPVKPDLAMSDYPPGSPIWRKANDFNRLYLDLLDGLRDAFHGRPDMVARTVPKMLALKYAAVDLMRIPLADHQHAGPTFERPVASR